MAYVDPWASGKASSDGYVRSEIGGGSVEESNRSIIGSLLHGAGVALDAPYQYIGKPVEKAIYGTLREGLIDTGASDWLANHDWNKKNDVKGVKRPGFNIKEALGLSGTQGATLSEVIKENPETFPHFQSSLGAGLEFMNRIALDPLNAFAPGAGNVAKEGAFAATKLSARELGRTMIERSLDAGRGLTVAEANKVAVAGAKILKDGRSAQKLADVREAMDLVDIGKQVLTVGHGKAVIAIPGTEKLAGAIDTVFTGGPLKGLLTEKLAKSGTLEAVKEKGFNFQPPVNRDLRQAIMETVNSGDGSAVVLHQMSTGARRQGVGVVSTVLRSVEEDTKIRYAEAMGVKVETVDHAVQVARKELLKDADRGAMRAIKVIETGIAKTPGEKLIKAVVEAADNAKAGEATGLRGLQFANTTTNETTIETISTLAKQRLGSLVEVLAKPQGLSGIARKNLSTTNALDVVLGAADDLAKSMWAEQQGRRIAGELLDKGWNSKKVADYSNTAGVLHAYTKDMEQLAKDLDLQERIGKRFKGLKGEARQGRQEMTPFLDGVKDVASTKSAYSKMLSEDAAKLGVLEADMPAAEALVREGLPKRTKDLVEITSLTAWDDLERAAATHRSLVQELSNPLPGEKSLKNLIERRKAILGTTGRGADVRAKMLAGTEKSIAKITAENETAMIARKEALTSSWDRVVDLRLQVMTEFGSIRNALSDEALSTMQGAEKLAAVISSETEYWRNLVQMYGEGKTNAEDMVQTILGRSKDVAGIGGRDVSQSLSDSLRAQSVVIKTDAEGMVQRELKKRFKTMAEAADAGATPLTHSAEYDMATGGREAAKAAARSGADVFYGQDADLRFIQTMMNLQGRQMVDMGYGTLMDADVLKYIGRLSTANDSTRILSDFNRVTNIWRSQILALPGFSNRNWIGGFLQNWQDGIRVGTYSDSSLLFKSIDSAARDIREVGAAGWTPTAKDLKILAKHNMSPEQAVDLVQEIGFQFSRDIGAVGPLQAGPFMARLEKLQSYMDQSNPFTAKAAATLGKATGVPVEMNLRMSHVMGLMEQGVDHAAALDRMYLLHNDYADLSKFDIQVKRFFPFWVWRSRNLPLQAHLLATTNYLGRALQMEAFRSQEIAAADGDSKPPFLGLSSIAAGNRGFMSPQGVMGSADLFDNAGDIGQGIAGVNPSAILRAVLQPESVGPVFKVPAEMLTGHDMFTDKALFQNGAGDLADYTVNQIPILAQIRRSLQSPSLQGAPSRVGNFLGNPATIRHYDQNG